MDMGALDKVHIQSTKNDRTTDDVTSWISFLNKKKKINFSYDQCEIKDFSFKISNSTLSIKINGNNQRENVFWYRRGHYFFKNKNNVATDKLIYNESIQPIDSFISNYRLNREGINSQSNINLIKLEVLKLCVDLNIKVPNTLVTDRKIEVINFFDNKLIVKPIENPILNITFQKKVFNLNPPLKILKMSNKDFINLPEIFMLSFFQEYIEKQFEIRTFYLNGIFKSMAIFSQQNEKTKEDFRNYDYSKPNRNVPFQLPKNIEKKLHKLMIKLDLNCGSFDIIYTPNGKYYFLEVNPIGQFQWLSQNCNYFLERMIAQNLIS